MELLPKHAMDYRSYQNKTIRRVFFSMPLDTEPLSIFNHNNSVVSASHQTVTLATVSILFLPF